MMRFYLLLALSLFAPYSIFAEGIVSQLNDWVSAGLSGEPGLLVFAFVFIGGVLASFLPCTYPLVPITVGIIRARSEEGSKYLHPILYYTGIAFMYFIFGIIAALSGGAFNRALKFPVTNLLIGSIIFLLALSSLELIFLPIFSNSGINAKKGKFGTFLFGMGAGLLSSPCVGPVVVALLLKILEGVNEVSISTLWSASSKMFFFGAGVGLPFFLIGVLGVSLPRSGKWMKYIQIFLGLVVLYFAYTFIEKGLILLGWDTDRIIGFLTAGLVFLLCIFYIRPQDEPKEQKVKYALISLGIVISFWILGFQIYGNRTTAVAVTETKKEEVEVTGNLTWFRNPEDAYRKAEETGKNIFIDFYADWCTNCKEFTKLALSNEKLNTALSNSVLLKIYDTDKAYDTFALDKRFGELNVGLPFFIIFSPRKKLLFKTTNYQATEKMIQFLNYKN